MFDTPSTSLTNAERAKKPEIPEVIAIYAATANGWVGKADGPNGMPWSFSLDMLNFQNWTMGFPFIAGKTTALQMAKTPVGYPLPGRPCAIVSKSLFPHLNAQALEFVDFPSQKPGDPKFNINFQPTINFYKGPVPVFNDLEHAINSFPRFKKIFLGGGVQLFNRAFNTKISYPEAGLINKPLVDTIIKTEFSDEIIDKDSGHYGKMSGDVSFDDSKILKDFQLRSVQELILLNYAEVGYDYRYAMRYNDYDENMKPIDSSEKPRHFLPNPDNCDPWAPYVPTKDDPLFSKVTLMVYTRKKEIIQ